MSLIALGLNHLSAPIGLREQVTFTPESSATALRELTGQPGIKEAIILSTCNRTELYANVAPGAEQTPANWLKRHHHLASNKLDGHLYHHNEGEAVRHLFRVATGLDSMVLGEPQILGQVKQAYQIAHAMQTLKAPMERLFQHTFSVAKKARTNTCIGAHTVSIAFTAVRLAEQLFSDLGQACVLLLGAGDNIELTARHLADKKVGRLLVSNRRLENAQKLAQRHGGYAISLSSLPKHLAEADIVIASTASRQPIIDRTMLGKALSARHRRPMFLVDIAVPRDIAPEVADLDDVFLYDIDDFLQIIDNNRRSRGSAAHEANAIIDLQVEHYMTWYRALDLKNPALALRRRAEGYRNELLIKARAMIERGKSSDEALTFLANVLTNKLLHHPSARLREATMQGDLDLLHAAELLHDLDQEPCS